MPSPAVGKSFGLTIAFATSLFTAEILGLDGPGESVGDVDTTHQLTTGHKTYLPEDIVEGGEVTFECHYNPDTAPKVGNGGATEVVTLTEPGGATLVWPGYVKGYSPKRPFMGKMVADVTVKVAGIPVRTPAA